MRRRPLAYRSRSGQVTARLIPGASVTLRLQQVATEAKLTKAGTPGVCPLWAALKAASPNESGELNGRHATGSTGNHCAVSQVRQR